MKTIKKQRPIQRRKVLNLCTIFRLAKPAFFKYLKKASRNIVHKFKTFLRCIGLCFFYNLNKTRLIRNLMSKKLKGPYHGHFLALLVKRHQNYDLVLSTMQEMLLELKGKDSSKEVSDLNSFHQFFQTTRTKLEKVRLTFSS